MGPFEFHRLADRELNEAAQYYDCETAGLGLSFLREVERCLQSIAERPEAGVILAGTARCARSRALRRIATAHNQRLDAAHSGVTALAQGRKRRARPSRGLGVRYVEPEGREHVRS